MKTGNKGFTFIELLAAIFISGIVLAGLYSVFISQQAAFSAQEQIAEMTQNIRAALDLMSREIRLAGYKTSTGAFNGIAAATVDSIRVLADLNQDGDTLDENEEIRYAYDSGAQKIYRNEASLPVADHIIQFSFTYTLSDGSMTSNPIHLAEIRKVTISMTGRTAHRDRAGGGYRTMTLTSDVTLRNLGS